MAGNAVKIPNNSRLALSACCGGCAEGQKRWVATVQERATKNAMAPELTALPAHRGQQLTQKLWCRLGTVSSQECDGRVCQAEECQPPACGRKPGASRTVGSDGVERGTAKNFADAGVVLVICKMGSLPVLRLVKTGKFYGALHSLCIVSR